MIRRVTVRKKPHEASSLAKLLLLDVTDAAPLYDITPFGAFRTDDKGRPEFMKGRRCYVGLSPIRSAKALDTMLSQLIYQAARWVRRYTKASDPDANFNTFAEVSAKSGRYEEYEIFTEAFPEEIGRLVHRPGSWLYGAVIYDPWRLSVVEHGKRGKKS